MELNYLKNKAYQTAKNHGWHDEEHSGDHWGMLIITEIGEAVQADRSERYADLPGYKETYNDFAKCTSEQQAANMAYDFNCKNTFEDELADICIRTLDMAGVYGLDLSGFKLNDDIDKKEQRVKRFSDMLATEWGFITAANITDYVEDDICANNIYKIILSVFLYAKAKNINLQWFIENKMLYNESRPFRHGGKKY